MSQTLELCTDLLTAPSRAVETALSEPNDGRLLLVFAGGVLAQALSGAIASGHMISGGSALVAGAALGALVTVLFGASLVHFAADLLGGDGDAVGLLRICALIYFPNMLLPPFALVGGWLFELASLAVFFWQVILLVAGMREVYRISSAKAVAAVLMPLAFLFLFLPAAGLFLALLAIAGMA